MKRLMVMALIMAGCMNPSRVTDRPHATEPVAVLVLTYSQQVTSEIVPEPAKKADYARVEVDPIGVFYPPWVIDSMRGESMNSFVKKEMDGIKAVVFYDSQLHLTPIGNDVGWGNGSYAVADYPLQFSTTQYNGGDSNRICIDSIAPDQCAFLSINSTKHVLRPGDSLCHLDTVYGRTDSTWCWQRLIITRTMTNVGIDTLPNQKYAQFF